MKILLVQTSFLGDVILSTPVIAALKTRYPQAELWMMITPQAYELVRRDPLLAGVIPFHKRGADSGMRGLWRMAKKIRAMNFDCVYALHRSLRTSLVLALAGVPRRIGFSNARGPRFYHERHERPRELHEVQRNLCILDGPQGVAGLPDDLRLFAPDEVRPEIRAQLEGNHGWAALAPGSVWKTKRWFADGYREVAERLVSKTPVVVLGGPGEEGPAERVAAGLPVINLAGRTSLAEMLFIIKHARLLVCNDSMALHVASAFKIPTVTIFCATSPEFGFGPWKNIARVVEKQDLLCKPCARHGGRRCPLGTEACMRELPASAVLDAIEELRVL